MSTDSYCLPALRAVTGQLAAGEGVSASALAPRYVRRAEAEVRRTGLRFEPAGA